MGTIYIAFHLILKHRSWIELKFPFIFNKKGMDIQMLVLDAALLMLVNFIAMRLRFNCITIMVIIALNLL
jgi:hypothetical protein